MRDFKSFLNNFEDAARHRVQAWVKPWRERLRFSRLSRHPRKPSPPLLRQYIREFSAYLAPWARRSWGYGILLALLLVTVGDNAPPQSLNARIAVLISGESFNFTSWQIQALWEKMRYGLLSPQRWMDETQRARFVLDHLANVGQVERLRSEIEHIYTDPSIDAPEQVAETSRAELAQLRAHLQQTAPLTEAILGEQVAYILQDAGLGTAGQVWPPVSATFTPLPSLLVLSPRAVIQSERQAILRPGYTAAEADILERRIESALPDRSAYVTAIGGLSAYPSMLLESSSLDWVTEVLAHEWTHHYLTPYPLGLYYETYGETRAINETTAELMGRWAGQAVVERFYRPLLNRPKPLPQPLARRTSPDPQASLSSGFDFYAEMHATRVAVDRLLAEGRIEHAELYMELKRRYIVAQGYNFRRMNQAFFALHGAYASRPGAAGADPVGPAVRRLWALSRDPHTFLRRVRSITRLSGLP